MQALDRCRAVLADDDASAALSIGDRDLLKTRYRRLRRDVEATDGSRVPLHGDAHTGNLAWAALGGFRGRVFGPHEYDIASLPPEAWPYFGDADSALVRTYAELRSVCVAIW